MIIDVTFEFNKETYIKKKKFRCGVIKLILL